MTERLYYTSAYLTEFDATVAVGAVARQRTAVRPPVEADQQPPVWVVGRTGDERRPRDVGGVRRVELAGLLQVEVEHRELHPQRSRVAELSFLNLCRNSN